MLPVHHDLRQPGLGIPGRGHPAGDAALAEAATELVYTGMTCGKRLVVLVGLRKALAIAVKGARARKRWSKLRERLAAAFPLTC